MSLKLKDKVALGTVQFGINYGIGNSTGKTPEHEVSKILDLAYQNGISLIDTAQAYGSSEKILGKYHQNRFKIITKLNSNLINKQATDSLIEESLKKLQVESIYGVLFHSILNLTNDQKIYKVLLNFKSKNVVEKLGISATTIDEIEIYIEKFGLPDILQIPYNIVDRRFKNILIDLHKQGVEIHSRSTFLQGLLFTETSKLSSHFNQIKPFIDKLQNHFRKKEKLARFLLLTVLENNFIDKVIIGVNNSAQLLSNLSDIKLKTDFLDKYTIPELSDNILNPSLWPKN
tara:strand:- start:184 stop:1047 length:864 start_codon:yes stop_codon:yes gene_type:complete